MNKQKKLTDCEQAVKRGGGCRNPKPVYTKLDCKACGSVTLNIPSTDAARVMEAAKEAKWNSNDGGKTWACPECQEKSLAQMRETIRRRERSLTCKDCYDVLDAGDKDREESKDIARKSGWVERRGWHCPRCAAKLPKRTIVHERGDLLVSDLGTVTMGDAIVVADPCYKDHDTEAIPALGGEWHGYAVIRKAKWWGPDAHERTVMLVAAHQSVAGKYRGLMRGQVPAGCHSRETFGRDVDSGQMAVYAAGLDLPGSLYHECCDKSDLGGQVAGKAFASDTCLGDGGYEASLWKDANGKAVAVTVKFWNLSGKT